MAKIIICLKKYSQSDESCNLKNKINQTHKRGYATPRTLFFCESDKPKSELTGDIDSHELSQNMFYISDNYNKPS